MERVKPETFDDYMVRLKRAAETLTPDQIAACAWVMGTSGCGWNKENIICRIEMEKAAGGKA